VESEYQRFSRFKENDIDVLQRKFFLHFILLNSNYITNPLVEKYKKEGRLAIDEFINLIKFILNEKYQVGKASVIYNIKNGIPPDGWQAVRCMNCNKLISGAMLDPTTEIGTRILNAFGLWTHPFCRVQ
jgi:Zn-finger domain-containing protein